MLCGEPASEGNHPCIISSESWGSEAKFEAVVRARLLELFLKGFVAGNSSGDGDDLVASFLCCFDRFFYEAIDDCSLK